MITQEIIFDGEVHSSGAYRHWGDDFIDGAGNWVKCNF